MKPGIAIAQLQKLKEEAELPEVRASTPAHESWKAKVEAILAASLGKDAPVLEKFKNVSYWIGIYTGAPGEAERDAAYFANAVSEAVGLIDAAIFELELTEPEPVALEESPSARKPGVDPRNVFLVHGHDDGAKHHAARVLAQLTGAEPTILHEQPSGGKTVIEKLDHHAMPAAAAVILLTPDDVGSESGASTTRPRARQNVVFELGYFIGKLGRGNVIALVKGGVEIPSDISGVVYINMDLANWPTELAKELRQIDGLTIDIRNLTS
jgi:predicted nucleotide-binding protein